MEEMELVSSSASELTVRHNRTGHEFTYYVDETRKPDGDALQLGPVREGAGPKTPGDIAADAHAFAKREAARLGLI